MDEAGHLKRGNLLWESSRMFLPEHKEQLLEQHRRKREYLPPELGEDRLAELNEAIGQAMRTKRAVVVVHAGLYGAERFFGRITRIDPQKSLLRIEGAEETLILRFDLLLDIELPDNEEDR